jgi:hypothetical protein
MTDSGGSIQPCQPKGDEVLVRLSEGYAVVTDDMADRYGAGMLSEVYGIPAANILRIGDWIRDHYRDGTFRCPSGGGENDDSPCPASPASPDA